MPRKPLGDRPMSNAERQARHRAVRAAALPVIHYRRAADHRSRCLRATFIADPEGITVNDLSVGRNPEEVLRMLDALKPMSCARAIGRRARRR